MSETSERAARMMAEALEAYLDSVNEDEAKPCEQGGYWIDGSFSHVQELQAAAEAALKAWKDSL